MDLVFPAEHGLLTAGGLPVAESDTQLAHTRPEPFRIYAVLPGWLADGMSVVAQVETLTDQEWRRTSALQYPGRPALIGSSVRPHRYDPSKTVTSEGVPTTRSGQGVL